MWQWCCCLLPLETVSGMCRGQKVNMRTCMSHDRLMAGLHTHTHTHLITFALHVCQFLAWQEVGRTKDASGRSFYHFSSENERFCPFVRFSNYGWGIPVCSRKGQMLLEWSHASRVCASPVVFLSEGGGTGENPSGVEFLWAEPRLHLHENVTAQWDSPVWYFTLWETSLAHKHTCLLNTLYFIFDICCISEVISMVECVLDQYRLY